ncbi:hypothetical protein DICSQDRAFT_184000 [Dichomitus squalens LYAD-421 SS1]|uniref:Uncharacterized protein n=1 Tax=Dichomitus squalens (strain LYAD-421) TaxID=732165 RepID=R7SJN6_DICSQ|nr:uncharacterized protein DICSQDRAFT_184000 [Dichomitus squalens LYAD-421 SS1]EJF56078.1 hypothetical protein DICSQDRAFT_184000 [Dichomitus squalens LYAD-421 SS1]
MATATITRLSPTMPSQGSYDYLYQANVGLQNLHSVWAHGPRAAAKENGPTLKRAKTSTSFYDTSSPSAVDFLAIGLEYRLACALGRKTVQLRDRCADSPAARLSVCSNLSTSGTNEPPGERPVLEDWTSDYVFDDNVDPFAVAEVERTTALNPHGTAESETSRSVGTLIPERPSLVALQPSCIEDTRPTPCDTPAGVKATTFLKVHAPKAIRPTHQFHPDQFHPDLSGRSWRAPGPSPLARSFSANASATDARDQRHKDEDEGDFARSFNRHHRLPPRLRIWPLPRSLGRKDGSARIPTPLLRELQRSHFLSQVCFLDVEAPELDFVDERSMEWLLDIQADLLSGRITIPGVSRFALAEPPRLGTSHRCLKWVQGSTFPRRVKDYGKAADDMLARRRAKNGALIA